MKSISNFPSMTSRNKERSRVLCFICTYTYGTLQILSLFCCPRTWMKGQWQNIPKKHSPFFITSISLFSFFWGRFFHEFCSYSKFFPNAIQHWFSLIFMQERGHLLPLNKNKIECTSWKKWDFNVMWQTNMFPKGKLKNKTFHDMLF